MPGTRTTLRLVLALGAMACTGHPRPPAVAIQAGEAPADEATLLVERRVSDSLRAVIAALAAIKAVDPDVRRLAQAELRDHLASIDALAQLGAGLGAHGLVRTAAARGMAPVVAQLTRMPAGAAFDSAYVVLVLVADRYDQEQQVRLRETVSASVRGYLDATQPMLEWHLRMAEALRASRER